MQWTVSYSYLRVFPKAFAAIDTNDLIDQVQQIASRKRQAYVLEIEDFTDEVHFFVRLKGKRYRFANLQFEG